MKNFLVVLFAWCSLAAGAADLPKAAVWWKMDAITDGKVKDLSGNGRDLTLGADCYLSNVVYGTVTKKTMPTVYFPGTANAYGVLYGGPAMVDRTIVIWLCRDTDNGPLYPNQNTIPYLYANISCENFQCDVGNSPGTPSTMEAFFQSYVSGQANVYPYCYSCYRCGANSRGSFHLVVTRVKKTGTATTTTIPCEVTAFFDGEKEMVKTNSLPATLSRVQDWLIGNNGVGSVRPIKGHIAEFRVYDSALTNDQIYDIYDELHDGELLAAYEMDEYTTNSSGRREIPSEVAGGTPLVIGDNVEFADGIRGQALKFEPTSATISKIWSVVNGVKFFARDATVAFWYNISSTITNSSAGKVINPSKGKNDIPNLWRQVNGSLGCSSLTRTMINNSSGLKMEYTYLTTFFNSDTLKSEIRNAYVDKDTWAHITYKFHCDPTATDGKYDNWFCVYANGELVDDWRHEDNVNARGVFAFDSQLRIGADVAADANGNNRVLHGMIDDFRIYRGNLTDDQIRAIYRGPAAPHAGADFTTTLATPTLCGWLGDSAENGWSSGASGEVTWEVVSTPAGGEAVTFGLANSPYTTVTLPVEGEYVLRLKSTSMEVSRYDEITVRRIAPVASNLPPTVSLAATQTFPLLANNALAATVKDSDGGPGTLRVRWRKQSGPGGVWFDPVDAATTKVMFSAVGTYVLRCTAEDGQDSEFAETTVQVTGDADFDVASLDSGLIGRWRFNETQSATVNTFKNEVDGGSTMTASYFRASPYLHRLTQGVEGLGFINEGSPTWTADGPTLPNTGLGESGVSNQATTEPWRTVSVWVHHIAGYKPGGRVVYNPGILAQPYAFDICYLYNPTNTENVGFQIYQGWGGWNFAAPADPLEGRWAHVCVALHRMAEQEKADKTEVWVDGVKLATTTFTGSLKSRSDAQAIRVGGAGLTFGAKYDDVIVLTNSEYGITTRTFPGVLDDLRIYNRKLTEDEIRYLSSHPNTGNSHAPLAEAEAAASRVTRGAATQLTATVSGDPVPYSTDYTYQWVACNGSESNVIFSDPTSRSTAVSFVRTGEYTIKLQIDDGQRKTYSDPITITVTKSGYGILVH